MSVFIGTSILIAILIVAFFAQNRFFASPKRTESALAIHYATFLSMGAIAALCYIPAFGSDGLKGALLSVGVAVAGCIPYVWRCFRV